MTAAAGRLFDPGRTFLHPAFDYLLVGGGLSLVATLLFLSGITSWTPFFTTLPVWALLINLAHFAASTVRLYSKPGSFKDFPFVTMGLPVVTLAVLAAALAFAETAGRHLMNLYLTWSPYHYAAQTYGLAVMYCYRSGLSLAPLDRRLFRIACLSPFLYAFFKGPIAGLEWFVPATVLSEPTVAFCRAQLVTGLGALALALPLVLMARHALRGRALPFISILIMVANATWWTSLQYTQSFFWVATFHALQYLAIVMIFHVRERMALPGNRHGWPYHAASFYLACLALAYLLFNTWPYAFVAAGFGFVESTLLVVAVVNVHHFLVDAYIWRLRRDPNYRVVSEDLGSPVHLASPAYATGIAVATNTVVISGLRPARP
jgi:hypothetical protein